MRGAVSRFESVDDDMTSIMTVLEGLGNYAADQATKSLGGMETLPKRSTTVLPEAVSVRNQGQEIWQVVLSNHEAGLVRRVLANPPNLTEIRAPKEYLSRLGAA